MKRTAVIVFVVLCAAIFFSGCGKGTDRAHQPETITMATTTSTDNSGLLKELLPPFTQDTGIKVNIIACGTGKAIKHGENGDVDVILVHAKAAEEKFVSDGFGIKRVAVMYNDFVIIGPASDPAGIKGTKDASEALKKIADTQAPFVSRGDDSGTHKKEKKMWEAAGITPEGEWYIAAGQGMGAVLVMANEKKAYTLTDRGTYIAYGEKIDIPIMVEGAESLLNPYSVIAVNPEKHAHVKKEAVQAFIDFLVSDKGQKLIGDFRVKGQQLFTPNAE